MKRILKHGVGRCKKCGSSAVYSRFKKKVDGKEVWAVVCSNPECAVKSSGHFSKDAALQDWNSCFGA